MAALFSTAPAFRAALIANLAARSELATTQVSPTYPAGAQRAGGLVFLGDTKISSPITIPTMRGPRMSRQEEYDVEVVIEATCIGPLATPAEAEAFRILGVLDSMLADDPVQGMQASGVQFAWITTWDHKTFADDARSWAAQITAQVTVKARLV